MRGRRASRTASPARSMSLGVHRASPQTTLRVTSAAMARTDSKSPWLLIGKPASMTSTPIASSTRATSSFSASVSVPPGACSPSRRVVSKIRMVSAVADLSAVPVLASIIPSPENEKTPRSDDRRVGNFVQRALRSVGVCPQAQKGRGDGQREQGGRLH